MLGVQSLGPLLPAGALPLSGPPPVDGPGSRGRAIRPRCERDAWVVLLSVPGLGPVTFMSLLEAFGTASAVLDAAASAEGPALFDDRLRALTASDGRRSTTSPGQLARRVAASLDAGEAAVRRAAALGLEILTLDDAGYPERLRRIELPPPLLFVQGSTQSLSADHAVAVVGTRCPTDRGRRLAGWIASAIARTGAVVVSGLAVGIDGAAHAAAVSEPAPTVAVLGGGHANLFPKAHARLADAICAGGGAVISELPPDTPPSRGTFPRRNRVISGLADAVVVVEAGARSGALITAGWALEQGRECFLLPGSIEAPQSQGCNSFLRAYGGQARVVSGVAELIEDLGISPSEGRAPDEGYTSGEDKKTPSSRTALWATMSEVEETVAGAVAGGAATADQLVARTNLPAATVLSVLTLLELRGLVTSAYGRYSPAGPLAAWRPESRANVRRSRP